MSETREHFESEELARERAREALLPNVQVSDGRVWSSFVVVMRAILPAIAIIFAISALSWPFLQQQEVSFTLSREEVAKSDGVVLMQNLVYVGTLDNMQVFRLEAEEGLQDSPAAPRIKLTTIKASMELPEGVRVFFQAGQGVYETKEEILSIAETVTLTTTNGYQLSMNGAVVNIKEQTAVGKGPIIGITPVGSLTAGRVDISADDQEATFSGGVKMRIEPRKIKIIRAEKE